MIFGITPLISGIYEAKVPAMKYWPLYHHIIPNKVWHLEEYAVQLLEFDRK